MMTQVESHLNSCEICSGIYRLQILADKVIDQEKELQPDPFLATRILAAIENPEDYIYKPGASFIRVLKPVLVTISMAAAILSGIMLGNLTLPVANREKIPVELALINDDVIESVNTLLNE